MALTKELILAAHPSLNSLAPDALAALITVSTNDETVQVAKAIYDKTGEHAKNIETDVLTVSGIAKSTPDQKYYDYLKEVITKLKTEVDGAKTHKDKIATLEAEKKTLEDGKTTGQEVLKRQLTDKENELAAVRAQLETETAKLKGEAEAERAKLADLTTRHEFAKTYAGITWKPETIISKEDREFIVKANEDRVLQTHTIETIPDGKGGQMTVLRNKTTQQIEHNPGNSMLPYTVQEFLMKGLSVAIDATKTQKGAGSAPPAPGGPPADPTKPGGSLAISAKDKVAADEEIRNHLIAQGVARGTDEFQMEHTRLREENKVDALPMPTNGQ